MATADTIKSNAATVVTVASACTTKSPKLFPPTAIHARKDACHRLRTGEQDRTSTDFFKVYIHLLVQNEVTRFLRLQILHRKTISSRGNSYDSKTFLKIDGWGRASSTVCAHSVLKRDVRLNTSANYLLRQIFFQHERCTSTNKHPGSNSGYQVRSKVRHWQSSGLSIQQPILKCGSKVISMQITISVKVIFCTM